ncbi:uncharacterized protein LOC110026898 [Phalaenopsis equestris]|uniref:uncharacterized protein LOC110026898 n=1 Tax=Phalaenopsis equestris TaxID=78828 RepID=UPI0009E57799|nr:uncharacterized protein LOC110026898 [Phalaenopsis equestris]
MCGSAKEKPGIFGERSGEGLGGMLMAAAVAAHSFSLSPVPLMQVSWTTSKSPQILTSALPLHHDASKNYFPVLRILCPPQHSRKLLRAAFKVSATDPKTENEENQEMENKSKSLAKQNDNMKALIQAYKKAFLNGDEKILSETGSSICILEKETNELSLKSTELISEIALVKDKFLRLNADFENFRKRTEKDRRNFTSDNRAEVIECLLPIVDSFERVKQQRKPKTERERKIDASYQGIYRQFVEILRSIRVSVVETVGRPFDPSLHEAISREKSQQFKSGIVMQEVRRGFLLGNRVLRQASVKVSTGPGPEKSSSAATKSMEQTGDAAEYVENSATASAANS